MKEVFDDDAHAIIDSILGNPKIETAGMTRRDIFNMGCSIARKRAGYTPKDPEKTQQKRTKKKKKKSDVIDLTAIAMEAVAAARADLSQTTDEEEDEDKNKDADNADKNKDADDLVALDRAAQNMRGKMKTNLEAAKGSKKGSNKGSKKTTPPKRKTKKSAGEEKTGESPPKKKKSPLNKDTDGDAVLREGMRVMGKWCGEEGYGTWYEGTVLSVNTKKKTIHIKFDDGDEDDLLSWSDVSIID